VAVNTALSTKKRKEYIMSTKDTLENLARNTWLAGLGSIESSKEVLGKSIDAAQQKSNKLYNELVARGEEIQHKINDTTEDMQAKGKKFLGLNAEKAQQEKLEELNTAVDHLTSVIVKLIEQRNEAEAPKKVIKKTTAKPKPKTTPTVDVKVKSNAAAKVDAQTVAKVDTKLATSDAKTASTSEATESSNNTAL